MDLISITPFVVYKLQQASNFKNKNNIKHYKKLWKNWNSRTIFQYVFHRYMGKMLKWPIKTNLNGRIMNLNSNKIRYSPICVCFYGSFQHLTYIYYFTNVWISSARFIDIFSQFFIPFHNFHQPFIHRIANKSNT